MVTISSAGREGQCASLHCVVLFCTCASSYSVVQLVQVQVVQRQIELYHCSQLHWRYYQVVPQPVHVLAGGTAAY